ncbi:aldehyde dehydrogenase family protein [Paraglaciecola arctica]|uniref:Aldehyde dehydrogenase n=1 Tax=Paraglaciecola arctica BSs20135 TaxID=493475 RepID=K6YRB6_9ALTE|nr:aldehyde dehydrogenase family protein [Paraglaciecola arctica]GAC19208.1 aldehyde dehydrogenase [Paraglaciecola arctica BSs20135]
MQTNTQTTEFTPTLVADIAPKIQSLKNTFSSGSTKALAWRIEQLQQIKKMVLEQQDNIFTAMQKDLGRCDMESWTAELGGVVSEVDHSIKHLKKWMKPRKVSTPIIAQPGKSYILPEPLGTILIIGAWNYPLLLVLSPLVAAVSAGNCALIKPSELSANMSKLVAKMVSLYLDNDAIDVVEGAVKETTELLKHQFDHIIYTGGEVVGKIVMRAAAEFLTPVTLELGGKSPCIVDSSTDLDVTAARIVWSKWMNAGQTCVAPDYVLVEKSFAPQLIDAIKNKIAEFYGADVVTSKDYGRIVSERHCSRIIKYLEDQNVVFGGTHDLANKYIEPTIVLDPSSDSPLMQEEIFGPILPIITMDNISQAIPYVNAREKPLALYLFSKNSSFEQQVLTSTSAGMVCINDGFMFAANPNLPFGGVGSSGTGAYHGKIGFDNFSHLKTVMKRSFWFDVPLRYPPFTSKKFKLLKKLI